MNRRSHYVSSLLLKTWAREGTSGGIYRSSEIMICCNEQPHVCTRPSSSAGEGRMGHSAQGKPERGHMGPQGLPSSTCRPCRHGGAKNRSKTGHVYKPDLAHACQLLYRGSRLENQASLLSLCSLPALTRPAPLQSINLLFPQQGISCRTILFHKGISFLSFACL